MENPRKTLEETAREGCETSKEFDWVTRGKIEACTSAQCAVWEKKSALEQGAVDCERERKAWGPVRRTQLKESSLLAVRPKGKSMGLGGGKKNPVSGKKGS